MNSRSLDTIFEEEEHAAHHRVHNIKKIDGTSICWPLTRKFEAPRPPPSPPRPPPPPPPPPPPAIVRCLTSTFKSHEIRKADGSNDSLFGYDNTRSRNNNFIEEGKNKTNRNTSQPNDSDMQQEISDCSDCLIYQQQGIDDSQCYQRHRQFHSQIITTRVHAPSPSEATIQAAASLSVSSLGSALEFALISASACKSPSTKTTSTKTPVSPSSSASEVTKELPLTSVLVHSARDELSTDDSSVYSISIVHADPTGGSKIVTRRCDDGHLDIRVVYSREFIIAASASPLALFPPPNFREMVLEMMYIVAKFPKSYYNTIREDNW
ncbi:unnamed protein product [Thelazia callipaeda]|uniref:Pollen-specific leucine-rich repeat extensin-like protein 2 n=1 Tax=Thelazia callipaeda TaxID=103827 RepID=A0A0N5D5Z6_THECL|nr:unnamed protein product [Thelazia callipaeda]